MKRYLLLLGGFLMGMLLPFFAFAQNQVGITISPLTFELTANPGEVVSNKVRITNSSGGSIAFDMEVQDFTAAGEQGDVVVENSPDETYSMRKWIVTDPQRFSLEAGGTQEVDFTISVPQNAEPGGHYGTVLATVKGTAGITGAAIAPKVGSLILLSVSGPIREEMFIREFTVPNFSEVGPVPFVVRLDNTGSVHVKPIGFITIADFFGNKVDDLTFTPRRVLPGNTRRIDLTWEKKYPIGKYTATLVGSFGISNTPFSAVTTFWVFPWKIGAEILAGIVVLLVILVKTRKRFAAAFKILFRGEAASSGISNT